MNHLVKAISFLFILALFTSGAYAHNKVVVIPLGDSGGNVFASCKEILDAGASTGDGSYMIDTVGDGVPHLAVYCDMAIGTTYEAFGFGNYNATYIGYTLPDITTWQNAAFQQAYIWHRNSSDGFRNLDEDYISSNCCVYLPNDQALYFGSFSVRPYSTTTGSFPLCNPSSGYTDGRYYFQPHGEGTLNKQIPTDYFTTNAVSQVNTCSIGNNPGIFVKSYQ